MKILKIKDEPGTINPTPWIASSKPYTEHRWRGGVGRLSSVGRRAASRLTRASGVSRRFGMRSLNPEIWTLNPESSTLNPQPWALNLEPYTLKSFWSWRWFFANPWWNLNAVLALCYRWVFDSISEAGHSIQMYAILSLDWMPRIAHPPLS